MLGWNPEPWQGRQAPYHCLAFPAHTLVFKEHHGRLSKTQSHHLGQLKLCAVVLWLLPILGGAFNDSVGAGVGEELRKCIWWLTEPTCAMEPSPVPFGWGVATRSSLSASFCCTVRLTKEGQRPLNPGVACPLLPGSHTSVLLQKLQQDCRERSRNPPWTACLSNTKPGSALTANVIAFLN